MFYNVFIIKKYFASDTCCKMINLCLRASEHDGRASQNGNYRRD